MRRVLCFLIAVVWCMPFLSAWAAPKQGKLKLKNNPVPLVGEIEEFSDRYEIKLKFGKVRYKKTDVDYVIYDSDAGSSGNGDAPKATGDTGDTEEEGQKRKKVGALQVAGSDFFVDYLGRFSISVPEGYKLVDSTHPLLRVLLVREDEKEGYFMNVSVTPIDGDYPDLANTKTRPNVVEIDRRVTADSKVLYESPGNPRRCSVTQMFNSPVLQTYYTTGKRREGTVFERRFKLNNFEFSLRLGCPTADRRTFEPTIDKLFESFSFVPELSIGNRDYVNYAAGFLVRKPNDDWNMSVDIFDEVHPLKLTHKSGEASLVVELLDSGTPESYMKRRIDEFLSRPGGIAKELFNDDGKRNGVPCIYRCLRGFAEKARTAREWYYFVATRPNSKILVIRGSANPDGPLKDRLKNDMIQILDSVQLIDDEVANRILSESQFAIGKYNEGLKLKGNGDFEGAADIFSTVLTVFPEFRQGFINRAECYRSLKRWKEYRLDLEAAQDISFNEEIEEAKVLSYYNESNDYLNQKEFEQAMRLMNKAFRGNRKNPQIIKGFKSVYREYSRSLSSQEEHDEAIKVVKKGYNIYKHADMRKMLIKVHLDRARYMTKKKELRKVLRDCEAILRLDKTHRQALSMRDSVKREMEKNRGKKKR